MRGSGGERETSGGGRGERGVARAREKRVVLSGGSETLSGRRRMMREDRNVE